MSTVEHADEGSSITEADVSDASFAQQTIPRCTGNQGSVTVVQDELVIGTEDQQQVSW